MGNVGTAPDPNNRADAKTLQAVDRSHQISRNGTYELPVGTDHLLFGNDPTWVHNIVGKCQLGGIMNFSTGEPLTLATATLATIGIGTITNTAAKPVVVGTIPSDMGK